MITGIWEIPYIQKLGIKDHCRTVLSLYDKEIEFNALQSSQEQSVRVSNIEEQMDLFLILEKWAERFPEIRRYRESVFAEREKENVTRQ